MKLLFLYLKAFSLTGGIEKFNRSFLKALNEWSLNQNHVVKALSPYDNKADERYFPQKNLAGFSGNRILFGFHTLVSMFRCDLTILGHINLSVFGLLLKRINPSAKLVLVVHGIEVWGKLSPLKTKLLLESDAIFSVSEFTRRKILENNRAIDPCKIKILPNPLDPYFKLPTIFEKPSYLHDRYNIHPEAKVLLTVARLSSTEKYKGYDLVIKALHQSTLRNENMKYLLGGKADQKERLRVQGLISSLGLQEVVTLIGFIKDEELADHYLAADLFVMPSIKEGFGIVFIEAIACGLKVVAGSKDGSIEAITSNLFGRLVDPESLVEIEKTITHQIKEPPLNGSFAQRNVLTHFGFDVFAKKVNNYLGELGQSMR